VNILGHDTVRKRLRAAIASERIPHAWMLHGQQGIGKSRIAQEMAQQFLCTQRNHEGSACGQCHSCRMLLANSHPDYRNLTLEEGKRDIPVRHVRDLLGFLALSGNESERRVAIIDDADRLNKAAANALLKGLEEPSSGCLLILIVHDLQRLPATVRSRCILQRCDALSDGNMRTVLQQMGLDAPTQHIARIAGQGRPGHVACLQDKKGAQLLERWQQATDPIAQIDIGTIQQLLASKWPVELLPLAIDLLLDRLYPQLSTLPAEHAETLLQTAWRLAEMPKRIALQKLTADAALLGLLTQLRSQLRLATTPAVANPRRKD